jgi:hypothetical protein
LESDDGGGGRGGKGNGPNNGDLYGDDGKEGDDDSDDEMGDADDIGDHVYDGRGGTRPYSERVDDKGDILPPLDRLEEHSEAFGDDCLGDERSSKHLLSDIQQLFDGALEEANDLATELYEAAMQLKHWKSSVLSLATIASTTETLSSGDGVEDDQVLQRQPDIIDSKHPYLSGLITSYLNDIRDGINNVHVLCSSADIPAK